MLPVLINDIQVSQEQNIRWAERAAQLRAEKPKIEVDDPIPHERVIYEVKFCPSEFLPKGANPIFALTLGENVNMAAFFSCSSFCTDTALDIRMQHRSWWRFQNRDSQYY